MTQKIVILACVLLGMSSAFGDAKPITKEALLEGCDIPLRREFPIDTTVKPCDDLYKYACDKVISSFKLRDDRSAHTFSFNDSYERILYAKKKYLKALAGHDTAADMTPHTKMLKNVYAACMNEDASKAEEKKIVGQVLEAVAAIHTRKQFMDTIARRIDQPTGEAPLKSFVEYDTDPNQDDPFLRDAIFDSSLMTLPERSYYDNPEVMKDYTAIVTDFFTTNGLDNPGKRAESAVAFEKEFAHHYPLPTEFRDRSAERNPTTRERLIKNYPNLEFAKLLKRIPPKTKLRNLEPETFEFLNKALANTSVDTLKDFLLLHSARSFMDDAYQDYFKKVFEFNRKNLGGPEKRPDREERCTKMVMNNFGREIDESMFPIFFPNFPEQKVVHLAETIRASIIEGLKNNKWLSPQGRAGAIKKLTKADLLLVKPQTEDEWDFTPPASYKPDERYANALMLSKNLVDKEVREYGERRNRRRWLMGPMTINAYYMPMDNVFVLPAGILQYPFYDPELPEKLNLGAIGAVTGHELGHSIDDKGAKYDETGRLHQWMSNKDIKEFQKRGGQFVERFEKIGHNGKLTLGENTADHVGLTFAFQAAFGKEAFDPTTPKSSSQLEEERAFFTQFARAWCQVMRPKYREMLLKTDPHASGEARVDEQVKHQPGFQEAFGCKFGDPMFLPAEERIRVW